MSNYWNTLSPIHETVTKGGRVGLKDGKKVDQGGKPVKRIILWKGKFKDFPGAKKAKEKTKK